VPALGAVTLAEATHAVCKMENYIKFEGTEHKFKKTKTIEIKTKGSSYSLYVCSNCGLTGKMPGLMSKQHGLADYIQTEDMRATAKCSKLKLEVVHTTRPKLIQITILDGYSKSFANLKPKTFHKVIECPNEYKSKYENDVWVQGIGEAVRLLTSEYKVIGKPNK
jgi:hypothetical protein